MFILLKGLLTTGITVKQSHENHMIHLDVPINLTLDYDVKYLEFEFQFYISNQNWQERR